MKQKGLDRASTKRKKQKKDATYEAERAGPGVYETEKAEKGRQL